MSSKRKNVCLTLEDLKSEAISEADIQVANVSNASCAVECFKKIDLKCLESLSPDIILCVVVVKFGVKIFNAMCSVLCSVSVLPSDCQHDVLKILFPSLSFDEAI